MSAPRIFVSYVLTGDERGAEVAQQFISDLQTSGAEAVIDNASIPDESFIRYLNQELPRCQYCILIQTPRALESLRVQTSINIALNLVAQQRMKGVLRILAVPTSAVDTDEQALWITPRAFDASQDYARARDKILLELNLLRLDDDVPERVPPIVPFSPVNTMITLPGESSTGNQPGFPNLDDTLADPLVSPAQFSDNNRARKPRTSAGQQVPVPADRPVAISVWYRRRGLWVSLVSVILILALALSVGAVAMRLQKQSTKTANSSTVTSSSPGASQDQATPTLQSTLQSINLPTATPGSTPATTSAGTPASTSHVTPAPTPTPVHVTIVDDLNDLSKIYSYTANLGLDQNNSQWMHGDTSLLIRGSSTDEAAVWKLTGMTSFQAITYFWPPQDSAPLSDLNTYVSSDGVHWNAVTPTLSNAGGNWTEYIYTLSNLSNVNFVKMHWFATSDNYWGQQIGQVTLKS